MSTAAFPIVLPAPARERVAPTPVAATIAVVRDAAGFAPYADAWAELMERHGPPSPFHRRAWLESIWAMRAVRLRLVLEGTPGRLRFGAAFCWADDAGHATLTPVRLLSLAPRLGTIHPAHAIVARAPDFDESLTPELLTRAVRSARWSAAFVSHLSDEQAWFERGLIGYARREGWIVRRGESGAEVAIDFRDGWDAYLGGRCKHWRDRVKNARNRCERAGAACRDLAAERRPWSEIARAFAAVADRCWQRGSEIGPLTPRFRGALLAALRRLHEADLLRAPFLLVGDRPIAVDLHLRAGDALHCILRAYDPAVEKLGVGVRLIDAGMRLAEREGVRRLRLGGIAHERTAYKKHWINDRTPVRNLVIVRPWSWYGALEGAVRLPLVGALWWRARVGDRLRERWRRRADVRAPR